MMMMIAINNNNNNNNNCDASRPKFLFKYKTSEGKLPSRPMRFKLAYARKARNKDKEGFGPKSCKKAKICCRKANNTCIPHYVYYHESHIFKESGEYVAICGSANDHQLY